MARYPQGVKTFIPQIQPYQVDFNFVNNVLKTKQSQYDTNWKQLNKLYGQIYYADLTREESKEKQEALVKQIDFNLKRISTMDLSLDQNVQAAKQIFQPFYEDKNLMKDIAWTKNTSIALSGAESLRNSSDEEQRARYWQDGVNAINYRIEEFKETPYDQIQSQANVRYTPYVDVMAKADAISKEFGDMVIPSFSADNRWMLSTTNGEALRPHLQKLFQLRMANDPAIQELYKTQAYVDRKNYMYQNADKYGGDKAAAEKDYLMSTYELLKPAVKQNNEELKKKDEFYRKTLKALEQNNNTPRETPYTKELIESYSKGKEVNDGALVISEKEYQDIKEGRSTLSTSTGPMNATEDLSLLRTRVDSLRANQLMRTDFTQAADVYSFRNFKQEIDENPYEMERYKQQNRMALERLRGQNAMAVQKQADKAAMQRQVDEWLVDNGMAEYFVNKDEYGNEFMDTRPLSETNTVQRVSSSQTSAPVDQMKLMNGHIKMQDNAVSSSVRAGLTFAENVIGAYTTEKQKELLGGYTLKEALEYVDSDYEDKAGFPIEELIKIHNGIQEVLFQNKETSRVAEEIYGTGAQKDQWQAYKSTAYKTNRDVQAYAATMEHHVGLNYATRELLLKEGGNSLAAIVAMGPLSKGVGDSVYNKLLTEMGAISKEDVRIFMAKKRDEELEISDEERSAQYLKDGEYGNYILNVAKDWIDWSSITDNEYAEGRDWAPLYYTVRNFAGAGGPTYEEAMEIGAKAYGKVAKEQGKSIFFAGQIGSKGGGLYSQGNQIFVKPNATSEAYSHLYQVDPTIYAVENDLSEGLEPGLDDSSTYMLSLDDLNTKPKDSNEDGAITDRQAIINANNLVMNSALMKDYGKEKGGVTVSAFATTGFDGNKAAYTIKLSNEIIDDNTAKFNEKGELTQSGLWTPEQAQKLKNNGYSIIADRGTFKSDLMSNLMKDTVTVIIDSSPDKKFTQKVGNNEITFYRNESGEINSTVNIATFDVNRFLNGDGKAISMTQDLGSIGLYKDVGEKSTDAMLDQFIDEQVPIIQAGNTRAMNLTNELLQAKNDDGSRKYTDQEIIYIIQSQNFYQYGY